MILTISAPSSLVYSANQLAMCVGNSAADIETFKLRGLVDSASNEYAVASLPIKSGFLSVVQGELTAPGFAPDCDMDAVKQAQAAMVVFDDIGGDPADPRPLSAPGKIMCYVCDDPRAALASMGLTKN